MSLVAAQLSGLVVVFAFILHMVSLASVLERLDAHKSIPLVNCVLLCLSLYLIVLSIETVVQVEPKVLTAVGHGRNMSRWDTLPCLLV